jgi:outer membrane protein insertion porin family
MFKFLFNIFIFGILLFSNVYAEVISKIEINGNSRITDEYILIFSEISTDEEINSDDLNISLKKLYQTGYFEDVKFNLKNSVLNITVIENPIIQTLIIDGIKAKKIKDPLIQIINLKSRSSFSENLIKKDEILILNFLEDLGYYNAKITFYLEKLENNLVNLTYKINTGEKARISKISFIGDTNFKNSKLKSIILSEEYKFWKFISGKKFLNKKLIDFDKRLLTNFYLNKGFYNIDVNSSFANYLGDNNFELIYNISPGNKSYFNEFILNLPSDYDRNNFLILESLFKTLKGKPYSIAAIDKILKTIDKLTLNKQYEFLNASVDESILDNLINVSFNITETEKFYVEKINILGNNITREDVIRNQLIVDEGDPFNYILHNRSINNLKSLNFFRSVESEVKKGTDERLKIINIEVEEKPTGEISAGAGVGTSGETLAFSVVESNFLGRGIKFGSDLEFSAESLRGLISIENPNYQGSNRSINATLESTVSDNLSTYGYKNTKTGFALGTGTEYFENLFVRTGLSVYQETIKTDATASANMQKQKGSYFDGYFNYTLDYDLRDQKFETTEGYRSVFSQNIPLVSENYSLVNKYDYKYYLGWWNDNVATFGLYGAAVNSLTGKNVKLSERLFLPSRKLRGFELGKIGPIDGTDYIGGNFASSINLSTTIKQVLPNSQNVDFVLFFDAANIWSVDYSSSIDDSDAIRSSAGVGIDWLTPIGPLNFSLSQPLSKASTDKTETFRFNLGTTF